MISPRRAVTAPYDIWRVLLHDPHEDSGSWGYLIPRPSARSEKQARAAAHTLHAEALARMEHPDQWAGLVISEVTLLPAVLSRKRALAWAALADSGAITPEHGWPLACERGERLRGEEWREELAVRHETYRDSVIGFGTSLDDVLQSLAGTPAAWDLDLYRDQFGRIEWEMVRADILHGATSVLRQTPYGLLWFDHD
ncbi:hypothetical protein AB0I10_12595 [Streptomyces sp. NPDC050636]|uniref:hypothetical protein n=1 Tax=Streptomyces sp. NPDC050636 TaxID=3154510 RepID=UPI0034266F09